MRSLVPKLGTALMGLLGCFCAPVLAQQIQAPSFVQAQEVVRSTPAGQLVAEVVKNELSAHGEGRFMYRDQRTSPEGEKTKELVETDAGVVARLIAINGQPLTPQQRAEEEARLQDLSQHPERQRQRQREQQQDDEQVRKLFAELPKAFHYQYEGTDEGKSGELIRLGFTADTQYQPSSRETSVFKAMSGKLWVAIPDYRLARIEATLFRDVTFGWGLFGRLDKGGHFFVEQSKIGPQRWETTYMNLQFTGKILLFKTLNLCQVDRLSDFHAVPGGLTLTQGIELLEKNGSEMADNNGN
jgi:hypothetical protein